MRFWKRVNLGGSTRTVESYSHDLPVSGAIEITEVEFQAFLDSFPPPFPLVDWKALWLAADTGTVAERIAKKLMVLAKRLELE